MGLKGALPLESFWDACKLVMIASVSLQLKSSTALLHGFILRTFTGLHMNLKVLPTITIPGPLVPGHEV